MNRKLDRVIAGGVILAVGLWALSSARKGRSPVPPGTPQLRAVENHSMAKGFWWTVTQDGHALASAPEMEPAIYEALEEIDQTSAIVNVFPRDSAPYQEVFGGG